MFASAYGPTIPTVWGELWEDLIQLCVAFPNLPTLIGGDFNETLAAADGPNDAGGRDQGSARFREVLAQLGLGEMGPTDKRFTWRGPTSQSRIDRFLYTPELLDIHALAEVTSLPRPLSDHTPILWASQAGPARPIYFKMDRSWFRHDGFKAGIEGWWRNHTVFGSATTRLAKKLLHVRHYLFEIRRQLRSDRTRCRDAALTCIQELDAKEDTHPLELGEIQERKIRLAEVAEVDLRVEMDWRQRSRQLWLEAGDANTRFFHQVANGWRQQNQVGRLQIGDRIHSDPLSIGQARADHFRAFYRCGPPIGGNGRPPQFRLSTRHNNSF